MASSGSFNTTKYESRYLTFSWAIQSQSVANNQTVITWNLKGAGGTTTSWYMAGNFKVVINGTTVYSSADRIKLYNGTTVASGTATIKHNADGTKTFSASAQAGIYTVAVNCTGSGSWALTNIPRYATVSQSLTSRTETTAVMQWTADSTIDYIWYSTNNGSSWTGINIADGKSGSYTISGLAANTTYKVKTRVRRKDSQLTTDSSALSVTTYAYPYANSMPNFTIGNKVTIGLFNPLGRSVTVNVIGADGSTISNDTTTGASISGYNSSTIQTRLLSSIPNSKTGTYQVKVTYGSKVTTKTGGTYSVSNTTVPSIGTVGYSDTNSTTVAITGNNQQIIQQKSTVRFTASGLSAGQGASLVSCVVTVMGSNVNLSISGSSASGGNVTIDSGSNITVTYTVTDSRGMTAKKTKTVTMLPYSLPSAIISCQRQSNYYSETDINVNAEVASLNGQNTVTIKCRYRKLNTSSWSSWQTLQDEVTSTLTLDNTYEWIVQVSVNDVFPVGTVYEINVPVGMPIVFYDVNKHSTGFNCFPRNNNSVEINGIDILKALFYSSGDTFTFAGAPISGMVSTSTTVARLLVPVGKSLANINSITVDDLVGGIRSASGGYFNGGSDSQDWIYDEPNVTVTATKANDYAVQIIITSTTAFTNTTNNTPCSMYVKSLELSFS